MKEEILTESCCGPQLHCASLVLCVPSDSAYDESAHLCFKDVTVDSIQNPQALRVRLKASKTDPFRVGVDIFVGRTGNELCPVTAVLAYIVKRGPSPGPFFRFASGAPLTRPRFVQSVKEALTKAGVDAGRYSGRCCYKNVGEMEEQCISAIVGSLYSLCRRKF